MAETTLDWNNGVPAHLDDIIRQQAKRVQRMSRGIAEFDDLVSMVYVYMVRRPEKVAEFWDAEQQDPRSLGKFRTIAYRRMLDYVASERASQTGGVATDQYYYHVTLVENLLPNIFEVQDRTFPTQPETDSGRRGKSSPSEGNNIAAMYADVLAAYNKLNERDQEYVAMRHRDHLTVADMAAVLEVSDTAVRKRYARIIERMLDHMGGEYR